MASLYKKLERSEEEIDEIEDKILEYQKQYGSLEVGDRVVVYTVKGYAQHTDEHNKEYFSFLPTYYVDQESREYIVIEKIESHNSHKKRDIVGQTYLDYLRDLEEINASNNKNSNELITKKEFDKETIDVDICIIDPPTKTKIYTTQKCLCKVYKESRNEEGNTQENEKSQYIKGLIKELIDKTRNKKTRTEKTSEMINALNNGIKNLPPGFHL